MKYNLKNCTFTIPFQYENADRLRNLKIVIDYLLHHFDTNIIVAEHGPNITAQEMIKHNFGLQVEYLYQQGNADIFPKTTLLNIMANEAETDVIVSMDADVVFDPPHYINAYNAIKNFGWEFVYPFNRGTVNLPEDRVLRLQQRLNINEINSRDYIEAQELLIKERSANCPQGGCLFMSRKAFWEIGGENEVFNNYNTEDAERHIRIINLQRKWTRLTGILIHLHHEKTPRSTHENGHWEIGWNEFQKVQAMSKPELEQYVNETFSWIKDGKYIGK